MERLDIGQYVELGLDKFIQKAGPFLDGVSDVIGAIISFLQSVLLGPPFWVMIMILAGIAYFVKAGGFKSGLKRKPFFNSIGITVFTILGLLLLTWMGYWEHSMQTLALVLASTFVSLLIGVPLGIWSARSERVNRFIRPILDFMQTMPAFVYLIPAILFFNVGDVPGVFATVVFSLPPAVRLTSLGIRGVPKEVVEAALSFGSTRKQLLYNVQIPLAMPTILAGLNQVIMLSLSMVVIASMVGAAGLGQVVYQGVTQARVGLGFESGLGIVILAIILDRTTQAIGEFGRKK